MTGDKMSVTKEQWQELNEMICRDMPSLRTMLEGFNRFHELYCGEYYDDNNLKGKTMVFSIVTTHKVTDPNTDKVTDEILISRTEVVASNESDARDNYIIDNGPELKGKEITILVAPFC